jgi:hypothetical protein
MTVARPESLPPHLRILVLGSSTSLVVGRSSPTRAEGTYGEILERRLRQNGINALLINESQPWGLVHHMMPRAVTILGQHSPDVILICYGLGEAQVNVFPTPLLRWLTTTRPGGSLNPLVRPFRNLVLLILRRLMGWSTPRLSRLLGMRTWRLRPKRFAAELSRLIKFSRAKTAALVLVLTPNPPGPVMEKLMPGYTQRVERYVDIARDVVARIDDPQVRLVEAGAVVEKLGSQAALYDGYHFMARAHEAVAALLEDELSEWLDSTGWGSSVTPESEATPG